MGQFASAPESSLQLTSVELMRSDLVHDFEAVDTDCTWMVLTYTPSGDWFSGCSAISWTRRC